MKTLKINNLVHHIFIIFAIMFLGSCSKDKIIENEVLSKNDNINFRSDPIQCPTIDNDLLVFQDSTHFFNYYSALNNLYDSSLDSFDATVYNCYNESFTSVYKMLQEDSFATPAERYMPFLTDPVMQSITNPFFEFKIGDALITYMNNETILTSDAADGNVQTSIRALPKGVDIDLNSIPTGAFWETDTLNESFSPLPCNCKINIEQLNCTQVKVWGRCKGLFWNNGNGKIDIEYAYGPYYTPPDAVLLQDEDVNGNWEFILDIPFNPIFNTHFINVSARSSCSSYTSRKSEEVFENLCDNNDHESNYEWAQDNGVQGFSHRVSVYKTWFASYEESKIWSKYWNGFDWILNEADLDVTINATRKFNNCYPAGSETETKSRFGSVMRVRVNYPRSQPKMQLISHCDGDVYGLFKKTLNWNGATWSINATNSLNEFNCCP